MTRFYRNLLLTLLLFLTLLPSFFCTDSGQKKTATGYSEWRNVYDTSIHYTGMETCRGCHNDIYETFIQTGMGQSFDYATPEKSSADFGTHAVVYDKDLDFYYKPYWQQDSLYIMEYRLEGADTIHKRQQRIDYIIGSGQHTNSHIFSVNGYLHQAPITFYTQKRRWDLAPGYENGANSRFSRAIESECMTCHNGYPKLSEGSLNKYISLQTGIDCERCHGPGSLHVAEKRAGVFVDTSLTPDYTIVNPRRLSTTLQNNVCQRCHLQGITVLQEGKSFFDFRPGMKLSEVMHVFMPQYEGHDDKMIMASHVERMKKSDCFVSSGKMSCISCHNPHVSIKFTPRSQYINACESCHSGSKQVQCTESLSVREAQPHDCITCHMPRNGSIDIPHVAVTDHYIRKRPTTSVAIPGQQPIFKGLVCLNDTAVDPLTAARAYMDFYERMQPDRLWLDSALIYLQAAANAVATPQNRDYIRLYFLAENYSQVLQYATALQPEEMKDAWTAYRIGEAYMMHSQPDRAEDWYRRAVMLLPYATSFRHKYGAALYTLGKIPEAMQAFHAVLKENPDYTAAHVSLGYLYMQQGNNSKAFEHMKKVQALSPDSEQNLINLAIWYHTNGADHSARKVLEHLLTRMPQHPQAAAMLRDLE